MTSRTQTRIFGGKSVCKLIISSNRKSDYFLFVWVFLLFFLFDFGFSWFCFFFFVYWNKNPSGGWVSACPEGLKTV